MRIDCKRFWRAAVLTGCFALVGTFTVPANAGWLLSGYSGFKDTDVNTAGIQGVAGSQSQSVVTQTTTTTTTTVGNKTIPAPPPAPPAGSSNTTVNTTTSTATGSLGSTVYNAANGVVNFAVFQNTTSDWAAALGVSTQVNTFSNLGAGATIAGLEGAAGAGKYVYFYQVTNTGLAAIQDIKISEKGVTSIGYIDQRAFSESPANGNGINSSSNLFIGPGTTIGSNPGNTAGGGLSNTGAPIYSAAGTGPTQVGAGFATGVGPFQKTSLAVDPISAAIVPSSDPNAGQAALFSFGSGLTGKQFSAVIFMVSDKAPTFYTSQLDSGAASIGSSKTVTSTTAGPKTHTVTVVTTSNGNGTSNQETTTVDTKVSIKTTTTTGPVVTSATGTYNSLPAPVPVPSSIALLLTGIPGIAGWYLRKRAK